MLDLQLAVDNAAAFWIGIAESRGHTLIQRPGYLVAGRVGRVGTRVLTIRGDLSPAEVAELTDIATTPSAGPLTVEDAYNQFDLSGIGFNSRQLPVMIRRPGPAPERSTMKVRRVTDADELAIAERLMVDAFPVETLQPYVRGEALPPSLVDRPEFEFFVIDTDGDPGGACVLVRQDGVAGLYWVTTVPEVRSRGVGRALMHAMLDYVDGEPVTLSASKAGKPLYDSLGFETIVPSTWWSRPTPPDAQGKP